MTREEAIKFLALVKVAYPTAYKDMDKESKLATVNMWHSTFHSVPFKIMELVFNRFIKLSKFPPTIADGYEMLRSLYFEALGDENTAHFLGDTERENRARWILTYTSPFRGSNYSESINYNLINEEDLKLLPGADTPILIGKENDDEAL